MPIRAFLFGLPEGDAGTRATLAAMASVVRTYRKSVPIRMTALGIVSRLPGKAFGAEAVALASFVRRNIRYVRDVRDVETLQTPDKTLEIGAGDCDDQATLLSALLESIGFQTRFVAIRLKPGRPFEHVFVEVLLDGDWYPLETTENWPFGTMPVQIAETMVEHV